MKTFPQVKFNKLKYFLNRLPKILAERSFITILVLFFLSLILGGFIYYKYVVLVKSREPQIIKKPIQFEEKIYKKILEKWLEKEKRFKETDLKEYPELFKSKTTTPPQQLTP